jgi:hypothetical protein
VGNFMATSGEFAVAADTPLGRAFGLACDRLMLG